MNFTEYQKLASRTLSRSIMDEFTLCNLSMGLSGESGETVDYLKKVIFHGHILDPEELAKELGDVLWYLSQIALVARIDLNLIAEMNIEKLKKRYPDGFDPEKSINREE